MVTDLDLQRAREVFINNYYEEHGTYQGSSDELLWWENPLLLCSIELVNRGLRCKRVCEFCIGRTNRVFS